MNFQPWPLGSGGGDSSQVQEQLKDARLESVRILGWRFEIVHLASALGPSSICDLKVSLIRFQIGIRLGFGDLGLEVRHGPFLEALRLGSHG